jgi:hypothetical protein
MSFRFFEKRESRRHEKILLFVCIGLVAIGATAMFYFYPLGQSTLQNQLYGQPVQLPTTTQLGQQKNESMPLRHAGHADALRAAIAGKSMRDLDQTLMVILSNSNLSKPQKFKLLWDAYEAFKNSKDQQQREMANAVMQAIVSIETKHSTAQLIKELNGGTTDPTAKSALILALTRQYEHSEKPEVIANNEAILAAIRARVNDQDPKVAAMAVVDFAAIGEPAEIVPMLDHALENGILEPWGYASRMISQLYNIHDAEFQLQTVQKVLRVLTTHQNDPDIQQRVLSGFLTVAREQSERGQYLPQSKALTLQYVQTINPLPQLGAPTYYSNADRATYAAMRDYVGWFDTVNSLQGQTTQQGMAALANDSATLNAVPERAAALLISRKHAPLFTETLAGSGNVELLASSLVRRAHAIPLPNDVSKTLIEVSSSLNAAPRK